MEFFRKTQGAISIFLVLVLLPMLTVSSVFIDASKVNLGKALAESAGDLTLNTALTNYDTKLKDLYGLMATAQNTDDLFARLEDYYRTCITSSGVSEGEANFYVEEIMDSLRSVDASNDTADLMNMELVSFAAKKYADADLANPTIIKKQVVDFMKYRAPINTGLSFVNSLKSFSTLSKQSELAEKKQQYYEAQQGVMENLKAAWGNIAIYNGTNIVTNPDYIKNIKSDMKKIKAVDKGSDETGVYKNVHTWLVKDIYGVKNYRNYPYSVTMAEYVGYTAPDGTKQEFDSILRFNSNGSVSDDVTDYLKNYSLTKLPELKDIKPVINNFYKELEEIQTAEKAINNATGFYMNEKTDYVVRFFVKLRKTDSNNGYTNSVASLYTAYQKMQAMMIWLDGYDLTEVKDEDGNVITSDSIKNETYLLNNSNSKSIKEWYKTMTTDYEKVMSDFSDRATASSGYATKTNNQYNSSSNKASTSVSTISTNVNSYCESLENSSKALEKAIECLEAAKTGVEGEMATAKQNWSNVANDKSIKDTSLAKQDKAEIDQLDNYLTAENISKLITRLTNINKNIEAQIKAIKAYKYCGKFIGEIKTLDDLSNVAKAKFGDGQLSGVSFKISELNKKVSEWWTAGWSVPAKNNDVNDSWVNQSGTQPDLTKDKLALYTYLYSHFASTTINASASETKPSTTVETEDSKNGKNVFNSLKSSAKTNSDGNATKAEAGQASAKAKDKNIKDNTVCTAALPSTLSNDSSKTPSGSSKVSFDENASGKSAAGQSASSLGSMFGDDFLKSIADLGEDLRNKLYFADYVMSMFSFDTIENEYKIEKDVSEVKDGDILSLTKSPISPANNYAYGAEVEYIIYGGGNTGNVAKAYGSIYAIRFGFNLVYAFATSEIRDGALAMATPISAATLGIIPVPLIQAVIIIALACCESGIDLVELQEGKAVPLYKSSKTWHCSISGLLNTARGLAGQIVKPVALGLVDAGVNQLNAMLDMTDEELNKMIDSGTENVENAVEEAYDQIITENANLAIQELTTLINTAIENTRILNPNETYEQKKADMKNWVKQEIKKWGDQQTGSDLPAVVKREAANLIANNSGTYIDGLFDVMESNVQKTQVGTVLGQVSSATAQAGSNLEDVGGLVMEYISTIRKQITGSIVNSSDKVKQVKKQAVDKVRESMNGGADKLKDTLSSEIDKICGTSATGDKATGVASLCSFTYSDYLRLFLLIALYTSEENVILRTADVIQVNMAKVENKKSYSLTKSIAYVEITAEVLVKPTFLALPLFAGVQKNPKDDTAWYTVTYTGIAGY